MRSISIERAIETLLEHTHPNTQQAELPLCSVLGRILAAPVHCPINQPPFDRSAVDGYSLRHIDTLCISDTAPAAFDVMGTVYAGDVFSEKTGPFQAVRIMTGAPIPDGCDCVVRQEDVKTVRGKKQIRLCCPMEKYENYCFMGEDMTEGQLLMRCGEKISAPHMGVLASAGFDRVPVYEHLKISVLGIGDELTEPGTPLEPGKIYNSNSLMIWSRLNEMGVQVPAVSQSADNPSAICDTVRAALESSDMVITSGGVSVGERDLVHEGLKKAGAKILFWGVRMKPGAPMLAAVLDGKLVMCLSGNPFAATATFELICRPAISKAARNPSIMYSVGTAFMLNPFPKASPARRFIRGALKGGYIDTNRGNHSSGAFFSMVGCNAFADIPAGSSSLEAGAEVRVVML